ncbi:hypothetical protein PXJ20_33090, partial [Paraburkholderia sp. A1RI_3L]|uniref:hypothetical protein n=1 Tax=Paraburkholderia TaxID=1822464 RepID=UPI003B7BE888
VVEVDEESDAMLLVAVETELDNDPVLPESELTVLLVLDRPVDSELMPVEVEVESEFTAWLVA